VTADDLDSYLQNLGLTVDVLTSPATPGNRFTVVRDHRILAGPRAGKVCDVGLMRVVTVPYGVPSAIHTRPAIARMDMRSAIKTQASELGPEWQYWSRRYDHSPTPKKIWAHVLTVLCEDVV
jgi:hypothetical protein